MRFIEQGSALENNLIAQQCLDIIEKHGEIIALLNYDGPKFQLSRDR